MERTPLLLSLLFGVGLATLLLCVSLHSDQRAELYDIPNFVYERTVKHFPEAEENWLNMAGVFLLCASRLPSGQRDHSPHDLVDDVLHVIKILTFGA